MHNTTRYLLLSALLAALPAAAADITFMKPCARANAVGSAFSTVTGDPCAVFYNPANLTTLEHLEVRAETGRRLSPLAPAGEAALTYIRPVPDEEGKTAGFGYHSRRQQGGIDTDSLTFSVGNRTTIKYLQRPLYYGFGLKLMSLRGERSHLGLGAEAGAQLENNSGLRTALVFGDVIMGLGRSMLTVTLGNSYRAKNTTLLLDLRARGSYSEFFMGLEQDLFNGLLQARAGKGQSLNGGEFAALGLGVNALPLTVDLTWSLPWGGYDRNAGYYGFTAGWRFGPDTYSEKLVGEAAREAADLKKEIDDLRAQRAALENSVSAVRVNKSVAETDLTLMQGRMRELETTIRELQAQALEAQYNKENPKPAKRYVPPPPERWPKRHKAAAGETLRSISSKYYGSPNHWELIYQANERSVSKGLPVEGAVFTIPAPPRGD